MAQKPIIPVREMKKIAVIIFCLTLSAIAVAQTKTDSIGVFAIRGSYAERIDVLNFKQTKISAGFKSKAKLAFDGVTSQHKFTGVATFRLYFGTPSPHDVAKYYMFTPTYSAKDFSVGKFDVKKDTRQLTTAAVSIIGSSTIGAEKAKDVNVETKQIRENVYEITVTAPAGEYCLMPTLNGVAGYAGVFDFTMQ